MSTSSTTQPILPQSSLRMEINGHPYYIKSKNDVPYIYDIDTNDEVGYWSSKKGAYVMFSLYNKLMNDLKKKEEEQRQVSDDSDSTLYSESHNGESSGDESSSSSDETSSGDEPDYEKSDCESEDSCLLKPDSETSENDEQKVEINEKKGKNTNCSLIMLFLVLFVYLTLQKEIQSVYFDFVFLILLNLLNTMKVFEIMNDE